MLDLQSLFIISATYYGGLPSTLLTCLMINTFQFSIYGLYSETLTAFLIILIQSIFIGFIPYAFKGYWKKWLTMIGFVVFLNSSLTFINYKFSSFTFLPINLSYGGFLLITGSMIAILIALLDQGQVKKRALIESEERYRMLIETSPDGICVKIDGTIIYANEQAAKIFGATHASGLIGKSVNELITFSSPKELRLIHKQFQSERIESIKRENRYLRLDGTIIELALSSSIVKYDGKAAVMVVFREITKQKIAERNLQLANLKLQKLSLLDGLTGIGNRRFFDEQYEIKWKEAYQNQSLLSIIIIDIDYFKAYNDSYGHLEGDNCLKKVAVTIEKCLQRYGDLIARYGGEEFIGILSETEGQGAWEKAECIRKEIENLQVLNEKSQINNYLTVSIGVVSMIPKSKNNKMELIDYADTALYKAKLYGRNRVNFYEEDKIIRPYE